jgi:hypothetical protein
MNDMWLLIAMFGWTGVSWLMADDNIVWSV